MSPIKAENRERYPADWKDRRRAVLDRAGNRCELCGVPNRTFIQRRIDHPAIWRLMGPGGSGKSFLWDRAIEVVLTVAHLDPTYSSHELKHLLALCQRCHLKIDSHVREAERRQHHNDLMFEDDEE